MTQEAAQTEAVNEDTQAQDTQEAEAKTEGQADEQSEAAEKSDGYKYANKFGSVDELEKGYKELTQKLREKIPPAPEEYKINPAEIESLADYKEKLEGVDISQDPMLQAALPVFKKHNISQEAVNDIVAEVLKLDLAGEVDRGAELEKLGKEGADMISDLARFNQKLPESERAFLESITTTAEGVKFAHKLISMAGEKSIPADESDSLPDRDPADLLAEAAKLKAETSNFEVNTTAQARYEALMDEASRLQLKQK